MQKTKIIATLGPSSQSEETIEALILAGMDIARLNFSHATADIHIETAKRVRAVSAKLGRHIAVLGDLPGPKMRTTEVSDPNGVLLISDSEVILAYDSK